MTRQATFKDKIRARMARTGERYAAARLALLSQPPSAPPERPDLTRLALPGYPFGEGVERDLGLLTRALAHAGARDPATGAPFSQARIFGLSGGIGFMYFLFEYQGHPPMMTFVCRSFSMPGPVIQRALDHGGIPHLLTETGSAPAARKGLEQALAAGRVAHLTVDGASLPAAGVDPMWVGQMPRQLNVVGQAPGGWLVDAGAPAVLDNTTLEGARAACRKEKHRAYTFPGGEVTQDPVQATLAALRYTARALVEAPYKGFASNFGLQGLEKMARLCRDPKDPKGWPRVFNSPSLAATALYRTWECATFELTPPAGGRGVFALFLEEASGLPGLGALSEAAALARRSEEHFARLAEDVLLLGGGAVGQAVALAEEIDEWTHSCDPALTEKVRALRRERDAVIAAGSLSEAQRRESFDVVGSHMEAIAAVETSLQRLLASL